MSKRDTWILRPGMPGSKCQRRPRCLPLKNEMGPPRGGAEGVARPSPKKQRAAADQHRGSFTCCRSSSLSRRLRLRKPNEQPSMRLSGRSGLILSSTERSRGNTSGSTMTGSRRLRTGWVGWLNVWRRSKKGAARHALANRLQWVTGTCSLYTLVYGGRPRETQRKVILSDLEDVFRKLELSPLMDGKPFTTGARRSLALQSFCVRDNEHGNLTAMRGRMQAVVAALSNSNVFLGSDQNKLWVSFSKPKETRLNGNHAAWIRRSVRSTDRDQEELRLRRISDGIQVWIESGHFTQGATKELHAEETRSWRDYLPPRSLSALGLTPIHLLGGSVQIRALCPRARKGRAMDFSINYAHSTCVSLHLPMGIPRAPLVAHANRMSEGDILTWWAARTPGSRKGLGSSRVPICGLVRITRRLCSKSR